MKALILEHNAEVETSPLKLVNIPCPEPRPNEIRLRVKACGVCRTDLHVIEGELPDKQFPIIPGHQVVGVVEKLGQGAKRFKLGARVGIAWLRHTCGTCEFCGADKENLCRTSRYTGYHENGGFAEYACVHENFAYEIPEIYSDAEATPLLCAGIIGYRALKRSSLPKSGRLGIFGFGSSAHITIQVALARGAEVFVASREAKHREFAKSMGATWVGSTFDTFPTKLDSSIIFAPAGEIVPVALKNLKPGGTLALSGIHMSAIPEMSYDQHLFHEKTLTSVEANTRQDGIELFAEAARIPIRPSIEMFDLENANQALIKLKHDQLNGTGVLLAG